MITMLNRMLFWSRARNRHGIHSPFVYDFLDRSLYGPEDRGAPPAERLLLAAIRHFDPKHVGCPEDSRWAQHALNRGSAQAGEVPPYDLYVFDRPSPEVVGWIGDRHNWHNDTVLFIGGLGQGGRTSPHWSESLEQESVRVCLETYSAALLFFRKEQAPQHFRIRI